MSHVDSIWHLLDRDALNQQTQTNFDNVLIEIEQPKSVFEFHFCECIS